MTAKTEEAWVKLARRQLKDLCNGGPGRLSIAASKRGLVELKATPRAWELDHAGVPLA